MKRIDINIPNQASIHTLKHVLVKNDFFPDSVEKFGLIFHPKFNYVKPFVISMLAAWGDYWLKKGISIECENIGTKSAAYLERMGLFNILKVNMEKEVNKHEPSGRFIPIKKISNNNELRAFMTDVIPLLHAPEHADAVKYCLSEMIRNVLEHAGGSPAFACAQYYPSSQTVSIGVVDCGIGISESLSASFPEKNEKERVLLSLMPGISGVTTSMYSGSDNAGAGLYFTKSIARSTGEYFALVTGEVGYRLRKGKMNESVVLNANPSDDRHDLYDGLPAWKGTIVAIEIGTKDHLPFYEIMNDIRVSYSGEINKTKRPKIKFT